MDRTKWREIGDMSSSGQRQADDDDKSTHASNKKPYSVCIKVEVLHSDLDGSGRVGERDERAGRLVAHGGAGRVEQPVHRADEPRPLQRVGVAHLHDTTPACGTFFLIFWTPDTQNYLASN